MANPSTQPHGSSPRRTGIAWTLASVPPLALGVLAALAVFATSALCILLAMNVNKHVVRETLDNELRAIALAAASQLDGDAHARLTHPSQQNGAEYAQVVAPLRKMLDRVRYVKYIYTIRDTPHGLQFGIDAAAPIDADADGVIDQAGLTDPVANPDPAMMRCIQTQGVAVTEAPYTDKWGTFLAAFAPVHTSSGRLECIVGVDMTAELYLHRVQETERAAAWSLLVGTIASGLIGVIVFALFSNRRKAGLAVEHSEKLLRALTDHAPAAVAMFDLDMRYVAWSRQWLREYGLEASPDLAGRSHYDVFPEISDEWKTIHRDCLTGNVRTCTKDRFVRRDGSVQWLEWELRPWTRNSGTIAGLIMFTRDITEQVNAEHRIAESEARLRAIIDGSELFAWEFCVEEDRFTFLSFDSSRLGFPREAWLQPGFWDQALHPDDRETVTQECLREIAAARAHRLNYRMVAAGGRVVHISDYVSAPEVREGRTIVRGVALDVTERVQSSRRLAESESRFRTLADAAPVMMWLTDSEGRFTDFNKTWLSFTGHTLDHERQGGWNDSVHPDDLSSAVATFTEAISNRSSFSRNFRLLRQDGSYRHVADHGVPRHGPGGEFLGYAGGCVDITERVEAERELASSISILREMGQVAKIGGWSLDVATRATTWTEQTRRIYEVPDDFQPTLENGLSFYPPESQVKIRSAIELGFAQGKGWDLEVPFVTAKGRHIWVRAVGLPEYREGRITRLYGAFQDITAQKLAEDSLRQVTRDAARLAAAIDAHADAVFLTDADARITQVNSAFERLTGYSATQAIGQTPRILQSGRVSRDVYNELWSTINSGRHWAGRLCNRRAPNVSNLGDAGAQPEEYWVDVSITPLLKPDGSIEGFVAVERDVTDRVKAEQQEQLRLEGAETRLRVAEALSATGSLHARLERSLQAVLGLRGLHESRTGAIYIADSEQASLSIAARFGCFPKGISLSDPVISFQEGPFAQSITHCRLEVTVDERFGGAYFVPLIDRSSDVRPTCVGMLCLLTGPDPITSGERLTALREIGDLLATAILQDRASRLAEIARLKSEEANRMKSEFLANMSHEIRTPMTAVLGYADLLASETSSSLPDGQRIEYVETIRRNGQHLLAVLNDILDLSKIEAGKMTVEHIDTDPLAILQDVQRLMQDRADAKGISLSIQRDSAVPRVIQSDPLRLKQIIVNLVGNAIKFTESGRVRLILRHDAASARLAFDVEDTGIGMSQEQFTHIFNAFVQADAGTTRRFGGTGLGLRISRSLAELLDGELVVRSTLGQGSVFTLTIPTGAVAGVRMIQPSDSYTFDARVPARADAPAASGPEHSLLGCRILVAEDGPDNRRLIAFHLSRAGAEVSTVENGRLALEALTTDGHSDSPLITPAPFDLVITDMQMPEMDGYSLATILRRKGWSNPIIALTAHAMAGEEERCRLAGCDEYIRKPFDRATLLGVCKAAAHRAPEAKSTA